jgi:hypothetical protein
MNQGSDANNGAGHDKVVVFYTADKTKFELEPGTYTIDQLKTKFGVQAGYVLELFIQGHFEELAGPIVLKNGMHFNSFVPVGQSS